MSAVDLWGNPVDTCDLWGNPVQMVVLKAAPFRALCGTINECEKNKTRSCITLCNSVFFS